MSTREVTQKHTNLCLFVSSQAGLSPTLGNFISLIYFYPRTVLPLFWHFAFVGRFTYRFLRSYSECDAELSDTHDIQCCAKVFRFEI